MRAFVFLVLLIFLSPFILFVAFILKGAKKVKESEWQGEVVDKIYNEKREGKRVSGFYTLVVKGDDGITRKVAVTKKMYDECKIGDRLIKPKGALNPVKQ